MTELRELVSQIVDFPTWKHSDKIRLFAWAQHALFGREHFQVAHVDAAYDALHLPPPGNLHRDVKSLLDQKDLLKSKQGLRVALGLRSAYEAKFGRRPSAVHAHELLNNLPAKLSSPAQRLYLDEALACFRHGAWRAAVIMTWNVAYDHLCEHTVTKKLAEFDGQYRQRGIKKPTSISSRSDLRDVRERDVIEICRAAAITDGTQHKCLLGYLDMRNDAAHPSGAVFHQPKVETAIIDLVETIILRLA